MTSNVEIASAICRQVTVNAKLVYPEPAEHLELELPGPGGRETDHIVVADRISEGPGKQTWQGRVRGDDFSNVTFSREGKAVVGVITTSDGTIYRLRNYAGIYRIIERLTATSRATRPEADAQPVAAGCDRREKAPRPVACPDVGRPLPESSVVDVLVVYTSAASSWASGEDEILAWIRTAEGRTNQSFAQSGVIHRIKVVSHGLVEKYSEDKLTGTKKDLENLIAGVPGLDKVAEFPDAGHADVRLLLVSNPESPGYACQMGSHDRKTTAFADAAYGVVAMQWLSSDDDFTHEIGHILGAGHPDDAEGGASGFGRGYSLPAEGSCPAWKSLMVRSGSGDAAPILYWSSPEKKDCADRPMGKRGSADNVTTLNFAVCTVASFRR